MPTPLVTRVRGRRPHELAHAMLHRVPPLRATYRAYHRARYWDPIWYHVLNRAGKAQHARTNGTLSTVQQRALDDLRHHGIAQLTLDELSGDASLLERVRSDALATIAQPEVQAQIAEGPGPEHDEKSFLVRALGARPLADVDSELTMLALDDRLLDIAASYLGISPRLKAFDLWWTRPVDLAQTAVLSQRWHRDYDDHRLVKMFLYLVDVDESMGPFAYVRGTHSRGDLADIFPTNPPQGAYPPDGAVEAAVPADRVKVCTGKAGTVILCDTHGLHQGGRSTSDPRILFMANYASDAANAPYLLRLGNPSSYRDLSAKAQFALRQR